MSNSGDFIFKKSLNEIAKDHTRLGYETIEVFLEDVIDEVEARPADYSNILPRYIARDRIIKALGEGAVLAQYAGHGGRTVWTHESIFDNADVEEVEETAKIPFMLVLSCYNGYFDKPGEPSMAEKLLRKERGGIIGMLSATRLTYGSGNDALNRIIFDMLFKRNIRQLGPLSFDSKVELLMTEGTGQIDVMMEYTLSETRLYNLLSLMARFSLILRRKRLRRVTHSASLPDTFRLPPTMPWGGSNALQEIPLLMAHLR